MLFLENGEAVRSIGGHADGFPTRTMRIHDLPKQSMQCGRAFVEEIVLLWLQGPFPVAVAVAVGGARGERLKERKWWGL